MVVVRIDKGQRDATTRLGVPQQRPGLCLRQGPHQQLVRHRVQALEVVTSFEGQVELAMEEEKHEVRQVDVREPLTFAETAAAVLNVCSVSVLVRRRRWCCCLWLGRLWWWRSRCVWFDYSIRAAIPRVEFHAVALQVGAKQAARRIEVDVVAVALSKHQIVRQPAFHDVEPVHLADGVAHLVRIKQASHNNKDLA